MNAIERRALVNSENGIGFYFPDVKRIGNFILCACVSAESHSRRTMNGLHFFGSKNGGEAWFHVGTKHPGPGRHFNSPRICVDDGEFVVVVDEMPLVEGFPDFNSMWAPDSCDVIEYRMRPDVFIFHDMERKDVKGICPGINNLGSLGIWTNVTRWFPEYKVFGIRTFSPCLRDGMEDVWTERTSLTEAEIVRCGDAPVMISRSNSPWEPAYRSIWRQSSQSWTPPERFVLPCGAHRPTVIPLEDGRFFASFRLNIGGGANQNTMMALLSPHALLAPYGGQNALFRPLDHCENIAGDQGYTGACQLEDGKILVVNYMNPTGNSPNIYFYKFGLDVFGNGELK